MAIESATPSNPTQSHPNQDAVFIIGAGLAGLFTALQLAPYPTIVIAAKTLGGGASSLWAQGGIAAAVGEGDNPSKHAKDTILAGAGLVDELIAKSVTDEAAARIEDLLTYGVPFDQDLKGKLALAKEAAHSTRRIVHVEGDRAGAAIMAALIETVKQTPSIHILEQTEVHKLASKNGKISALYLWPSSAKGFGQGLRLSAKAVVLATGGIGNLYSKTTNPQMARGEGIAMAARIGAQIKDPEFVQFHPTAMDVGLDPAPLATEALRGEGATLINNNQERFLTAHHKDAELAPRDIVARAVDQEIKAGRGAYLDCTKAIGPALKSHFPTVYEKCKNVGIDPVKKPIPVAPAAHFHMGGIATNAQGLTTIEGLWACGEVASTGLHGANRLASNSLLEAVVFGQRIANDIKSKFNTSPTPTPPDPNEIKAQLATTEPAKVEDFKSEIQTLRSLMFNKVGVVRDGKNLKQALKQISDLSQTLNRSERTKNMIITATFITHAALNRKESRGSHYRQDAKESNATPTHTLLTIDDLHKPRTANQRDIPNEQKKSTSPNPSH